MTGVPGRSRAAACTTSHGLTVVSLKYIAVRFGSVRCGWVGGWWCNVNSRLAISFRGVRVGDSGRTTMWRRFLYEV